MNLAVKAAAQLASIYQYQIELLSVPTEVDLLSRHSADCVMNYLKVASAVDALLKCFESLISQ